MKKVTVFVSVAAVIAVSAAAAWLFWPTPRRYLNNAKQYYDQKKYPEAAIEFFNVLAKEPQNRDARYYLVLSYLALNDVPRAVAQLNALLDLYPDDHDANLKLGDQYLAAGAINPDFFLKARQIAEKLLRKTPQDVDALILSGSASQG